MVDYDPTYTPNMEYRLKAIENALNEIWFAIQNTVSKEKLNRIDTIRQKQIVQLNSRIDSLITSISELEDTVNGLL